MTELPELPPVPPELVEEFYELGDTLSGGGLPLDMLKHIYTYVDKFIGTCVAPAGVCEKGCADCCRVAVEMTGLEAAYISAHTMFKHREPNNRFPSAIDIYPPALGYCPFINPATKSCRIYPVRPLACRVFHAMDDKKFCWPPMQKHAVYTMHSSVKENPIMERVTAAMVEINYKAGGAIADIRDFFTMEDKGDD